MSAGTYPSSWSAGISRASTGRPNSDRRWALVAALTFLPFAAILHHGVFYPHECMINPFGREYSLAVVKLWLTRDPSLLAGILLAVVLHRVGVRLPQLRRFVPAFLLAFLPLTIWIWDIPGAGRWVCESFHDLQIQLPGDAMLRTRHLYGIALVLFPAFHLLLASPRFGWVASALGAPRTREA